MREGCIYISYRWALVYRGSMPNILHKAHQFGTFISHMNRIYYTWPVRRFYRMKKKRIACPWWVVPNDMLGLIEESTEIDSFYIANVGNRKKKQKKTLNRMNLVFTVHVFEHKDKHSYRPQQPWYRMSCFYHPILRCKWTHQFYFVIWLKPSASLPSFPLPNPCQWTFKWTKKNALSIRKWI